MNVDGFGVRRVSDGPEGTYDTAPTWSPDGSRIAFMSQRDKRSGIYIVGATGGAEIRILPQGANDSEPNWSPNAQLIAFSSYVDDNWAVFVMCPDGSQRMRPVKWCELRFLRSGKSPRRVSVQSLHVFSPARIARSLAIGARLK